MLMKMIEFRWHKYGKIIKRTFFNGKEYENENRIDSNAKENAFD